MDAYTAIRSKKDTRAFSPRPIPADVLHRILQAGRMAGSSKNSQPCRLVLLRSQEQRDAIAGCGDFAKHLPSAPVAVAVVLLPGGGAFDAGRCAQNMMVAAWAEGITSCPTSMHHPDCARAVLGLPDDHHVQIVLPFGYPAEDAPPRESRPRVPVEDFVHEERWQPRE
ncbi:MAG TPA: nitroreductase [Dehalococcoidia bacterium]|nr:nitroreductase [Dehalococcoidia bacterium]